MLVMMLGYKFVTGDVSCVENEVVQPEVIIETTEATTTPPALDEDNERTVTLSSAHVEMLDSFGVDPETVPVTITSEQEACFRDALGEASVEEILAGDTPSLLELVKGKSCIE